MAFRDNIYDILIAVEDRRFHKHYGIDLRAVARALVVNLKERRYAQGGSTITQQLARMLYLNNRKTLLRKTVEAGLALYLEAKYTKQEILELYSRYCYLGPGIRGFSRAARHYFGKSLAKTSLEEKATLVAMLQGPDQYPIGSKRLSSRTKRVLDIYEKHKSI